MIHRAIVPANIEMDEHGQLKLVSYSTCLPCYDQKEHAKYQARPGKFRGVTGIDELFEQGEYDVGEYTAPEVARGGTYNYLVDFYSIGVIIRKLYQLSQAHERTPVSQNN